MSCITNCKNITKKLFTLIVLLSTKVAMAMTTTSATFDGGNVDQMIGGTSSESFNWLNFGMYTVGALAVFTMGIMLWKRENDSVIDKGGKALVILAIIGLAFYLPKKFGINI